MRGINVLGQVGVMNTEIGSGLCNRFIAGEWKRADYKRAPTKKLL